MTSEFLESVRANALVAEDALSMSASLISRVNMLVLSPDSNLVISVYEPSFWSGAVVGFITTVL